MKTSKSGLRAGATVRPCTCTHVYQDERYGPGMRVHTCGGKPGELKEWCTVCGTEKRGAAC